MTDTRPQNAASDCLPAQVLGLELNNGQLLTGGETLDVDPLLGTGAHARPGRAPMSAVSTRLLDAAKVDFCVSQLLVAVSRWCEGAEAAPPGALGARDLGASGLRPQGIAPEQRSWVHQAEASRQARLPG
jgi:hypothetical protein